ncbi:MAG: hypothetical protein EPN33_07655 [Acidobacteria bacterium]|nr:MAG: hypothetical protein EPN33_07655 [Acidobacteriota bacterium]
MRRWAQARWIAGFAAFTLIGTLSFFYHYLDDLKSGVTGTAGVRALEEFTGAYTAALLFLAVVWMVRRWPLREGRAEDPGAPGPAERQAGVNDTVRRLRAQPRQAPRPSTIRHRWRKSLAVYFLALPFFGAVFTTLMLQSRDLLSPILGMGPYQNGELGLRYLMEFANQISIYLTMVGAVCLFDLYRENRRRELVSAELREKLAQAQLEQLRLRLQPHFLFNTLNTISAAMYEDVDRADAMLTRLSALLRHTLEAPTEGSGEVSLAHEIETCRLYTEIMQARFEHGLAVRYEVEPAAEASSVPQFLLQPLVENAVRHGGGQILVRASIDHGRLALEVSNSARAAAAAAGHGLGLSSTTQRLQQTYGPAHTFRFGPEPGGGFAVRMLLPLSA